jgi:hypothetical protein
VVAPFNPLRTKIRPAALCSLSKVTSFSGKRFGGRRATFEDANDSTLGSQARKLV